MTLFKPDRIEAVYPQHCAETGLRVNGKLHWVHVISTSGLTYYALSEKRGKQAMDEIGFLVQYRGIAVHDFWSSYFKATGADHAMCCAHLLLELTVIFENHPEIDSRQHYGGCLTELSFYRSARCCLLLERKHRPNPTE